MLEDRAEEEITDITIEPTHQCFDDAIQNLIFLMKRQGPEAARRGEMVIVHAIIAPDGEPMAHAWIEQGARVFFTGLIGGERVFCECEREEYYRESRISQRITYTLWEAYAVEKITGHYGPWDPQIKRLCKEYDHGLDC